LSFENLKNIVLENQLKQNSISKEIVEFLRQKQKELIPLTQNIMLAQDQLDVKFGHDGCFEEIETQEFNEEFNALYDLDARIFGYNLTQDEQKAIMGSKN